jgi:hypothetical protein
MSKFLENASRFANNNSAMGRETILKSRVSLKNDRSRVNLSKLFTILLFACFPLFAIAQEITLFDSDGEAKAYIDTDDDDLTIYLWAGTPVAYLVPDDEDFDIYGFNGKHLGWFEEGIVRDHEGYALGFIKGAVNMYTKYEPYKGYKEYKPYKSYKEYAPYKPYYKNKFSNIPLSLFLRKGAK